MIEPRKPINLARPNYYQGVIQLRNYKQEVLDFLKNQLDKRQDVAITKTAKQPDGIDLYITSQQFIRSVSKKLKESFGGELVVSAKLHTRSKTGKDLYRVTALFRPAKYKRGDIVNVRGDDIRLIHVGTKVFGKEMKTGRRVTIRNSDLQRE